MQAVILAGGRGERLRPITDTIPKPMVPIKGKPFLEHQIFLLKKHGINDFVLCIGYLHQKILNYFQDGSRFGIKIQYSIEPELLGTGGALKLAEPLIDSIFLLINGDTMSLINYNELISQYKKSNFPVMITVYDNSQQIAENNIHVNGDGIITGYSKTSPVGMNAIDSGILVVCKKTFFSYMPNRDKFSFETEIYPRLIVNRQMAAYKTNIRFYDIGTAERLKVIEEIL
ncbi:MAG: nucleotidyltransferase family protein [bacterium]